jgi:hypothetical protein
MNLEEEIDNVFNNLLNETCYTYYNESVGRVSLLNDIVNLSDFTYLIPNLFRVCYAQNSVTLPYICPTYVNPVNTVNYFPNIINTNLIKSFLYFNFPSSINNFNNNYNFINNSNSYTNLTVKKRGTTYGSFTSPIDILLSVYSPNSLLIQLSNFNKFLNQSYNANANNLIINNFTIVWDYIQSCISYSEISNSNIYTVGNFTNNTSIDQQIGLILYDIQSSITTSNYNPEGLILLQQNTIFTILNIVTEVFQDIVDEIKYFFENKVYCKKTYMFSYNIPTLIKIYKNYYKNQIYTIENRIIFTNPYSTNYVKNSILSVVNSFINNYSFYYSNRYLVNSIYLNGNVDAIVIYNNIESWINVPNSTSISYWYYYLNVNNISPLELFNLNSADTNTYTTLRGSGSFSDVYNKTYMNSTSYSITNSILYKNDGLWPDAGYTGDSNIINSNAEVFYFSDKNNVLQSILFETLQSNIVMNSDGNGYNPGDSTTPTYGIVLQYY